MDKATLPVQRSCPQTTFMDEPAKSSKEKLHNTERRRQFFKSFEAKSLKSRSLLTQIADDLTEICGSTAFLIFHVIFFASWLTINTEIIPGTKAFDPYPFGFLTLVVSLEAIFLSIFVLVSQNRSSYINSLREEVHLRVNLIAEEEITKILETLDEMKKHMGMKKDDPEMDKMMKKLDTYDLEQSIVNQISKATPPLGRRLAEEFPDLLLYPVKKPIEIVQNLHGGGPTVDEKKKS
jgi:uncharacterized membrane protein